MTRRIDVYFKDSWFKDNWNHFSANFMKPDEIHFLDKEEVKQNEIESMTRRKRVYWLCHLGADLPCKCIQSETKTGAVYTDRYGWKYEIIVLPPLQ